MDADDPKYRDTPQISGTFMAFKKSDYSLNFVKEWLSYCENYEIIAPPEDMKEEAEGFYGHREDQSIFSIMCKKYGIKPYSDPSQYGRLPEKYRREGCIMQYYGKEDYKPFIIHHRSATADKKIIFKQYLCAVLPRSIGTKLIS